MSHDRSSVVPVGTAHACMCTHKSRYLASGQLICTVMEWLVLYPFAGLDGVQLGGRLNSRCHERMESAACHAALVGSFNILPVISHFIQIIRRR